MTFAMASDSENLRCFVNRPAILYADYNRTQGSANSCLIGSTRRYNKLWVDLERQPFHRTFPTYASNTPCAPSSVRFDTPCVKEHCESENAVYPETRFTRTLFVRKHGSPENTVCPKIRHARGDMNKCAGLPANARSRAFGRRDGPTQSEQVT